MQWGDSGIEIFASHCHTQDHECLGLSVASEVRGALRSGTGRGRRSGPCAGGAGPQVHSEPVRLVMSWALQLEWFQGYLLGAEPMTSQPIYDEPTYVQAYDPNGHDGWGDLTITHQLTEAYPYPSPMAAVTAWRTVPTVRPRRPDGQPNRPLMAWTVTLAVIPDGRDE